MARSTKVSESPAPDFDDIYESSPLPSHRRGGQTEMQPSMSPSPGGSISSDKENRTAQASIDKGKGRAPMGPPRVPSPSGKRKRMQERDRDDTPQDRSRRRKTVEVDDDDIYDPDQPIAERRKIRKGLRDLSKSLADNHHEWLEAESTGLLDTLRSANDLADQVKQTSDATIDSKLLVVAAEMAVKRAVGLASGDSAQSVDVDDFIGKCATFMRASEGAADDDEAAPSATQRQRRRRGEEQEDDNGEHLNWAHLGRFACLKHNSRPSVPGFMLGPLSLEKRATKITIRKAAFKHGNIQETRPEILKPDDIHRDENANLSNLCKQIQIRLTNSIATSCQAVEDETRDDMTDEEGVALLDKNGISRDKCFALFKFVINPYSFGQTVENMFYVSFLIRDGLVGIVEDERGLPYLEPTAPCSGAEGGRGRHAPSKHQAVLSLDMESWKHLIDVFDIKEPMIRHREEEASAAPGAKGWYT